MIPIDEKVKNIPRVIYINLGLENPDRKQYMEDQLNNYGIPHNCFNTKRLDDLGVVVHNSNIPKGGTGVVVSHLNAMKYWYDNFNEEYVIVCEDDHDFQSIKYWDFTWDEFLNNLPLDWQCVQLVRISEPVEDYSQVNFLNNLNLIHYMSSPDRIWGAASLMKRSFVKSILDRHMMGKKCYNLLTSNSPYLFSLIENILYYHTGNVYNFPLLIENVDLRSPHIDSSVDDETYRNIKKNHIQSSELILNAWKKYNPLA